MLRFPSPSIYSRCPTPARSCNTISRKQHTTPETPVSRTTHFGFQKVTEEQKAPMVAEVFHKVANTYDLMNDLMSAGIHRYWKHEFVNMLHPMPGMSIVDVAGGTGDIAFRIIDSLRSSPLYSPTTRPSKVVVCDINPSMLQVGRSRAETRGYAQLHDPTIEWVEGDAESLPLESESVHAYTIAFGIRNCTHVDRVVKEAFRVLKPGGRFMCLEFSEVNNAAIKAAYDQFSFNVIPALGQVVAGDRQSYQYLVESIRQFPKQEQFADIIREAGFQRVSYTNLTFGIAAIHSGFKMKANL